MIGIMKKNKIPLDFVPPNKRKHIDRGKSILKYLILILTTAFIALLFSGNLKADKNKKVDMDNPDRKSTRLNSSHIPLSRMPSSA